MTALLDETQLLEDAGLDNAQVLRVRVGNVPLLSSATEPHSRNLYKLLILLLGLTEQYVAQGVTSENIAG